MEFYVLRSERRQLETNLISGAADAFRLAASPIEKQDESIARNTFPGAGKPGQRTGSIVPKGTVRSFLFSRHFVPGYSHWSPFLLRLAIP
jgi:hypothetical protein